MPIPVGGDTDVLTAPPAESPSAPQREARRTMPLGLRVPPGTMAPDRPRRQRRRRWLVAAAIVAILLVILGLVLSGGKGRVRMPDFTGLTRHAASVKADRLGLDPVFRTTHSDQATGTIIDQLPLQGRRVPEGITIFLTVSSGPATTPSPAPTPPPSSKPPKPPGHEKGHGHGKGKGNEGEG